MGSNCLDILVVDDQPGVRYLLDIVIKELGHRAHSAKNGLEAVERVRTLRPDLVFMDVRMPIMDGLEALGRIKKMFPDTRVVIMTAYGSEDTIFQAQRQGAMCCMAKPFDVDHIKSFLDDFVCREVKNNNYKVNIV